MINPNTVVNTILALVLIGLIVWLIWESRK
jgi:hypothetical protein